jgi:hypothetical protein
MGVARVQAPLPTPPFHRWTFPDGTPWTEFHRADNGYLLRFPQLADFAVANDALAVTCFPAPGVPNATSQHLYLSQVLPLALSKRGKLVFHASAIEVRGGAVVFAGESGRGKSTLAASFAINGHPFLTDDGLVLEARSGHLAVLPSHPSIRLWEDSEAALIAPGTLSAPPVHYTPKSCFLAGEHLPFCAQPIPLRRVYFLGEADAPEIAFRRVPGAEAMVEWVKHSLLLDVEERLRLATHFEQIGRVAHEPIHYRLDYPRRFYDLARVRTAILHHLSAREVTA